MAYAGKGLDKAYVGPRPRSIAEIAMEGCLARVTLSASGSHSGQGVLTPMSGHLPRRGLFFLAKESYLIQEWCPTEDYPGSLGSTELFPLIRPWSMGYGGIM